jgi:hypothetical protein
MSRRGLWRTLHDRFDPEEPAPRAWRADRESSPAAEICDALDRPFDTPRVLLTGTVGTGKTTELLRIAEQRAAAGKEFVLFLDLVHHFGSVVGDIEALQHVSSWEVCFLVGMALIRAAEERFGHTFSKDERDDLARAWSELAKATDTAPAAPQLDVAGLAKSMAFLASTASPQGTAVAAGLAMIDKALGALKWNAPIASGKRSLPDHDAAMQTLLGSVNRILGSFRTRSVPVLFVLDGLDRIRSRDRAAALFLESEMIGRLACPLVVCAPWVLRHDKAIARVHRFPKVCKLANEPVMAPDDPSREGPGVDLFCEVYRRRVADLQGGELIADTLLRKLAYYSGGRGRDFVRSVRMLAEKAWDIDADQATATLVDKVIDEARRLMETGLDAGDLAVLTRVANDPDHELPAGETARELLGWGHLLSYSNGSDWFYPHALLATRVARRRGAGTAGAAGQGSRNPGARLV